MAGAPKGNENAMRTGFRAQKLPSGCIYIYASTNIMREQLESEVRMLYGEHFSSTQRALIQSAVRHEQVVQLAYRNLRKLGGDAPFADQLPALDRISKETDARDRCLRALGLTIPTIHSGGVGTLLAAAHDHDPDTTEADADDTTAPSAS